MAPSVVQSCASAGGTSASFGSAVTGGNSLVVIGQGYGGSGGISQFSTPTYDGSAPAGTSLALGTSTPAYTEVHVYAAIWLMPAVTGGLTAMALANTGGVNGFTALEVAGLGATPSLDLNGGTSQAFAGSGSQTAMPSGDIPGLAAASALLVGTAAIFGGNHYTGPGGWSSPAQANFSITQYDIVTAAAGNAYQYSPLDAPDADQAWAAMIVALTDGSRAGGAAPGLLMATLP